MADIIALIEVDSGVWSAPGPEPGPEPDPDPNLDPGALVDVDEEGWVGGAFVEVYG